MLCELYSLNKGTVVFKSVDTLSDTMDWHGLLVVEVWKYQFLVECQFRKLDEATLLPLHVSACGSIRLV